MLNITNSTLSGNSCNVSGGAIINLVEGTIKISFSTIAMNQAASGGGIYNDTGSVRFKNSIVDNNGNANYEGEGAISVSGVNFSTDNTCPGFTQVSTDDLKLGPLALNSPGLTETHALLQGSAAIDTVTDYTDLDGNVVITDQRGVSRPQKTAGDAGAYEYVEPSRGILFEEGIGIKCDLGTLFLSQSASHKL